MLYYKLLLHYNLQWQETQDHTDSSLFHPWAEPEALNLIFVHVTPRTFYSRQYGPSFPHPH